MDNNTASRLKIAHYVTAGNLPYIQMEDMGDFDIVPPSLSNSPLGLATA